MSAQELRELANRAAARVTRAREHLAQAEADLAKLSADIGIRHHSHTAVKLALREAESAEAVTLQLVTTTDKIKEPSRS